MGNNPTELAKCNMSEIIYQKPEDYLLDTLYNFQAYREISGSETEPAVFDENIYSGCSVFIDKNTEDRIVITNLPLDNVDFSGASVWLSNPDKGVEIRTNQWQASPYDVIFWIDKALRVTYFNPHEGVRVAYFPAQLLAERLDFPRVYPIPQSEQDPRLIPDEIEYVSTPQTNTYTLASRIFDIDLETKHRLIARRYGIIDYDVGESTTFDLAIHETLPSEDSPRSDEFDREFILDMNLGRKMVLNVIPWGKEEIGLVGNDYKIRVVREGMLISGLQDGREVMCIPTKATRYFIDSILHSASQNQSGA